MPPRRCSTLGRADFMRVPLPAAMITMFRAMPSSAAKAAIIGLWLLGAAAAGRLQRGTNWLQQCADAGLVVARRLHGLRRHAGAAGQGSAGPVVRLAPHDPAAGLCRPAGRGAAAGDAAGHAAAGVPLVRRSAHPAGRGPGAWRADGGRAAADAEAGAAGASGAALPQVEPGLRGRLPAATRRAAEGLDRAHHRPGRDAVRPARRAPAPAGRRRRGGLALRPGRLVRRAPGAAGRDAADAGAADGRRARPRRPRIEPGGSAGAVDARAAGAARRRTAATSSG